VVKNWKPIVAVLLIFAAGFTTGAMIARGKMTKQIFVHHEGPRSGVPMPPPGPPGGGRMGNFRTNFIERMQRELALTDEQTQQIEKIMRESHERMAKIWEPVEPQAKKEFQETRAKVDALLTADQRAKFDDVFKPRRHEGPDKGGGPWDRGPGPRKGPKDSPERPPE
jgi:hypothetical protein